MYLVNSNGTQYGPYGVDEINRMLAAGMLRGEDLAWTEGMLEWQALRAIPGVQAPMMGGYPAPGGYAPPQQVMYGAPGYAAPVTPQATSGVAVGSLVAGILSLLLIFAMFYMRYAGMGVGVAAVVLGHVARSIVKRSGGRVGGGGLAIGGLITGYLGIVMPIGMLAMAASYGSIMNKGRSIKVHADIAILVNHIETYATKHNGTPPSQAAGLRALVKERIVWDDSMLTDPWGEAMQYKVPGTHSKAKFDVWSKGPDKISGTEDDVGNWTLLD